MEDPILEDGHNLVSLKPVLLQHICEVLQKQQPGLQVAPEDLGNAAWQGIVYSGDLKITVRFVNASSFHRDTRFYSSVKISTSGNTSAVDSNGKLKNFRTRQVSIPLRFLLPAVIKKIDTFLSRWPEYAKEAAAGTTLRKFLENRTQENQKIDEETGKKAAEILNDGSKGSYWGGVSLAQGSPYDSIKAMKGDGKLRVLLTLTLDEFEYLHRHLLRIQESVLTGHGDAEDCDYTREAL